MLALVLFTLLQDPVGDVESLIRQLGDESIEVRERATGAILKLGEKARGMLERASASGSPEIKARIASILKSLDRARELRGLLTPPLLVSLSGEMTLREAVESLEKQGGLKTDCASWPDGKFRIEIKEAPFWKAMEEVCRASGKRTLVCDAVGPKLVGDRLVEIPSAASGSFRIQVSSVAEAEKLFSISLKLGYENPKRPVRVFVSLDSVKDDLGNELVGGFRPNLIFAPKYEQITTPAEKPLFALALELKSPEIPKPEAVRIVRLSGNITAFFGASEENIRITSPEAVGEWVPILEVLAEDNAKPVVGSAKVFPSRPRGDEIMWRVMFKSFDSRLVCILGDLWHLRDKSDKVFTGYPDGVKSSDPSASELTLAFQNAATADEMRSLEVGIPKRLIRKEIPFELKDIRIR
jgi:hypothetical protein